ncbi:MAG: hypothetical protein HN742_34470 [Lentisphaerae bacterium]|jgi:hypothetical protein|nr:hypothetical protein [Lentisphaerota bacterium]MBT4822234.1 hypothetical protein [Lentisphaerota bacterium]MBT5605064.1 hypothetical protein [Lentisphaerota bacterium]MBT7058686.1 hypothetical protein [Lentisphaerota bacterium]MBT7847027.1 hypothetical protein [Lentisphaerota bacterium]
MNRLVILAIAGLCAVAHAQDAVLSETFDGGMGTWEYAPGPATMGGVVEGSGERGNVLDLQPTGAIFGVNSRVLKLDGELSPDKAYKVSARIRSEGLEKGTFAFSICYRNADGRRLSQMSVHNLQVNSKPHDWIVKSLTFGKGSTRPFTEETAGMVVRFSFWDKEQKCTGHVMVDDVLVEEVKVKKTVYADWPGSVLVNSGDLQVRLESRSFWTLYRIDYQGKRLCLDRYGSHYGSVANFSGTGFIGSGHVENEDEQVLKVALAVDGAAQTPPKPEYTCDELVLTKTSKLRGLTLKSLIRISDDRILEDVVMSASEPSKLNLIYHFMHPWTTEMSDYLGVLPDGSRVEGEFVDDKGMKISKPVSWSSVYSRTLQAGAVTVVLAVPEGVRWSARYWDVPKRYRKHYLAAFTNSTVPVGQEFHFRVLTIPFAATAETWRADSERLAEEALKAADAGE